MLLGRAGDPGRRGADAPARSSARAPVPGTLCQVFPADNVWNMDISRLPVHAKSKTWKAAMHAGSTDLHPDFGPPHYGIPFDVVGNGHATTTVHFNYARESDPGPYPFGADTTIEGGSDRARDHDQPRHLHAVRAVRRGLEPGRTRGRGAARSSTWGPTRCGPRDGRRADAAGLPIFPGLVRWDEVQAGRIAPRDPVHGGLHLAALPVARAAPGRGERPALPADGGAVPAEAGLRPQGFERATPRWSSRR